MRILEMFNEQITRRVAKGEEKRGVSMIDIDLHRDSQRRLREINEDINDARQRKDVKALRQFTKEHEEECKVLALINRVDTA